MDVAMQKTEFNLNEVVDIPSGMGGTLPALILAKPDDETYQVRCIHQEFYPMWLLTIKAKNIKKNDGIYSEKMLKKARNLGLKEVN